MRNPKQHKFKKPPGIVEKFETILNGSLAFLFYTFLYKLGKSKFSLFLNFQPKLASKEFRFRKFHEIGYKYYFRTYQLRKAYALRMKQAIEIEKSSHNGQEVLTSSYLDIFNDNEISTLFGLDKACSEYMANRKSLPIFRNILSNSNRKKIGKVLLFGPSGDPQTIREKSFDRFCIMKPFPLEDYGLKDNQVLVVLNNIWSLHNKKLIQDWAIANPRAIIISPNELGVKGELNYEFQCLPKFIFGGLMGLQRALTILIHYYEFDSIEIEGFDFSLSKDPYKSWYPSMRTEEGFLDVKHQVLFANMNHDFLLNYCYTKKLREHIGSKMYGSLDPFLNNTVGNVLDLLQKKIEGHV
jgi:hypothetical protein